MCVPLDAEPLEAALTASQEANAVCAVRAVPEGRGAAQPAGGRGRLGGARARGAQGLQRGPDALLQVAVRAGRGAGLLLPRPGAHESNMLYFVWFLGLLRRCKSPDVLVVVPFSFYVAYSYKLVRAVR